MAPPTYTPALAGRPLRGVDLSTSSLDDRVRKFCSYIRDDDSSFDRQFLLENLELVSASKHANGTIGETVFTMTVQPEYCNRMGNLHGGAAATVFDICTTTALVPIAREGWWQYAGVTRNLNITYLRPAPKGAKITITSNVVHAGARLATIKGEIRGEDGKLLCMAEHLKANIDPTKAKL